MVSFHTGFGGTLDGVISIGVPAVAKGTGGSSPKSLTESLSPWVDKDGEPALNKEPPPPSGGMFICWTIAWHWQTVIWFVHSSFVCAFLCCVVDAVVTYTLSVLLEYRRKQVSRTNRLVERLPWFKIWRGLSLCTFFVFIVGFSFSVDVRTFGLRARKFDSNTTKKDLQHNTITTSNTLSYPTLPFSFNPSWQSHSYCS